MPVVKQKFFGLSNSSLDKKPCLFPSKMHTKATLLLRNYKINNSLSYQRKHMMEILFKIGFADKKTVKQVIVRFASRKPLTFIAIAVVAILPLKIRLTWRNIRITI